MENPECIRDVDEAAFAEQVIERSAQVPVVVDFWAAWCAPCRMLGPALEREIRALGGSVELAKVDVDANPGLATRFAVQGIPAVKAFRDGAIVADFTGAREPAFLRSWLAALSPSPAELALSEAEAKLAAGDIKGAEALAVALGEDRGARGLEDRIAVLERRIEFVHDAAACGGEEGAKERLGANPGDLAARFALASALAARGEVEAALEEFLTIVGQSRSFKNDGARLAMLALMALLGPDSDVARDFRRRLQIVT